ncbi:hypothetical protein Vadar_016626 [Vaccinium darrowii]|uniref:Uncharacterized protein n=1 Tax=Vaccinium darrowii TaxID=229202 RepID=A0ACB7XAA4_9ERIC|nr:hypothetical protein Vadar_016626 [Vaccinium darrowii]
MTTYANVLAPINGRELWPVTENPKLLPPDIKKRAGRPKKVRRREPEEEVPSSTQLSKKGVKMTCSLCEKTGHNKSGYKRGPNDGGGETSVPTAIMNALPVTPVAMNAPPVTPARKPTRKPARKGRNAATDVPISRVLSNLADDLVGGDSQSALTNAIGSSVGVTMGGGPQEKTQACVSVTTSLDHRQSIMWRGRKQLELWLMDICVIPFCNAVVRILHFMALAGIPFCETLIVAVLTQERVLLVCNSYSDTLVYGVVMETVVTATLLMDCAC